MSCALPMGCSRIRLGLDTVAGRQTGRLSDAAPRRRTTGARPAFPMNGATGKGRLRSTWRDRVPQAIWVRPNGELPATPRTGAREDVVASRAVRALPVLRRVLHVPGTGVQQARLVVQRSPDQRDHRPGHFLASALRRPEPSPRDKLLTFTDNRQDASLQAGHFNDFVHVSLLRSALNAALHATAN